MNNTVKVVLIVLGTVVVAAGLFFAGAAYTRLRSPAGNTFWGMPMMGGRGWNEGPSGPVMGGRGWNDGPYGPMMGGRTGGRRDYHSGPMMGPGTRYGPGFTGSVKPLTIEEAGQVAQEYIADLGLADLQTGEVMIFDNHAYVVVNETSTGIGAFELLVDPISKTAYPEHGPNVMWNLKYGAINQSRMMAGGMGWMMGGAAQNANPTPSTVIAEMPVTEEQAATNAQVYLDDHLPGLAVAEQPTAFYGYYTFDFEKDGATAGMLSVNGYNGVVFVHNWHGAFVEAAE